ncbi:Toprim domain-containing protein [Desulfitobacterium sp. LBE]|uniref:DUF3991 domain-containing protein n=1 Tax=Desulfitobacterium sp. LBE TaxID=884086 RepID=UPI00119BAD84|nr:DUF3991 domain-containing protein [Desulfitobacterium sp. LBE]TWH59579.1 Toprim domain-containing protein [Desulfitobacterium sp. LBE]
MAYVHFTDEEKQRANSVDLVDFLKRQGEQLIRSGPEWRWKRHDSVTIRGSEWFRHSRKEGGRAIDFVQGFYNLSFPEAVQWLLGGEAGVEWNQTSKSSPAPKREFALPGVNSDMRRVFAYLIKQRFIDRDVITHFAHEKLIYEDKEYHNAVFVGLDENGTARHAHKRGTYTQGEAYKGNVEGSDPRYSFHWIGRSSKLYVFEAPVDMLSFITLHRPGWKEHSYVTLDGVSEHAMLQQLRQNSHLKDVILCLDHDEAGIEANGRLKDMLAEDGYTNTAVRQSIYKDWNEDLKAKHGMEPIPAEEHPKLILLPQVCAVLPDLCSALGTHRDIRTFLIDCFQRLESLVNSRKTAPENTDTVKECLECMAAGSLFLAKELCRQMGRPVTAEQLVQKLQSSYRPHVDRGWLRTRMEDIRRDLTDIDRITHKPGIRGVEDQRYLGSSYLRLALDCVRTRMFIELGPQVMLPKQDQTRNLTMTM